uniref:Uncharacterized protein n=1 Tax=Romanomermis culicivorax TaxID=13658 RepID=A0A915L1H8_ROMCU
MLRPPNRCCTKQYLVTDPHVAYRQPELRQDNRYFLVDDYNVKWVVRVGELDRWFATNFGRHPLELTEPRMVE